MAVWAARRRRRSSCIRRTCRRRPRRSSAPPPSTSCCGAGGPCWAATMRRRRGGLPRAVIASAPESAPPPRRLGDRLEQALEHHADVEGEIERGAAKEPARPALVGTVVKLAICGVSLYLVAPSVLDLLASWRDLDQLAPSWLLAMALLQAAAVACMWAL